MDDKTIIRSIGDVTRELEAIGDKKFYDESLSETIKDSIFNVLAKISEVHAGRSYYHAEFIQVVKDALSEVVDKIQTPKIDLTPVMRIAENITAHNKEVLNAILNIPKTETSDSKYTELFSLIIKMIESNNEFIKVSMNQKEYLNKMEELINAVNKRPDSWEFKHNINYGKLESSTAIPKYKN